MISFRVSSTAAAVALVLAMAAPSTSFAQASGRDAAGRGGPAAASGRDAAGRGGPAARFGGGPGYSYTYYAPGYDGALAPASVAEDPDAVSYCMQTYPTYDPASGTYLGYDGLRHPCP
jgi:hypothetical protein